jgi:hypothetical protein
VGESNAKMTEEAMVAFLLTVDRFDERDIIPEGADQFARKRLNDARTRLLTEYSILFRVERRPAGMPKAFYRADAAEAAAAYASQQRRKSRNALKRCHVGLTVAAERAETIQDRERFERAADRINERELLRKAREI